VVMALLAIATRIAEALREPELLQGMVQPLADALQRVWYPPLPAPPLPAPVPGPSQEELADELERVVEESDWSPDEPEVMICEAESSRALLLEIIRRASHDWVLYRTSSRLEQLELANDAYTWLFEEKPGHPWWVMREQEGRGFTSFLNVCELLDVDPDYVRERVCELTPRAIKMAGRPAERRKKQDGYEGSYYNEHSVELVSLESLEDY